MGTGMGIGVWWRGALSKYLDPKCRHQASEGGNTRHKEKPKGEI